MILPIFKYVKNENFYTKPEKYSYKKIYILISKHFGEYSFAIYFDKINMTSHINNLNKIDNNVKLNKHGNIFYKYPNSVIINTNELNSRIYNHMEEIIRKILKYFYMNNTFYNDSIFIEVIDEGSVDLGVGQYNDFL